MSRNFLSTAATPVVAAFIAALLLAGCGGQATDDAAGGNAAGDGTTAAPPPGQDNAGTTGDGGSGTGGAGSTSSGTSAEGANGTAVTLTPAEERTHTLDDMRGLRTILMAELETVRARLGQTSTADAKKADQTRASELAQGLERIDRAIKTMDESTDVTWAQIRESSIKEAAEVRDWMAKYGMNVSS